MSDGVILPPMPGRIVTVAAADGDMVEKGQLLMTLEAMKMEHRLTAPFAGRVSGLSLAEGDQVSEGVVVARIEAKTA